MSLAEVAWRVHSALRDVVDGSRLRVGWLPAVPASVAAADTPPPFRVTDMEVGEWSGDGVPPIEIAWRDRLVSRADRLVRHRLRLFNLRDCDLGDPVDWNRDHASGKAAPLRFASSIDYRNFNITGDAKVVWELNRHHHLVVLARAYRVTGNHCYAHAVVEQLKSWLAQCPFGRGMNWRSPLELAIRMINWVWTIDLTRESGLYTGELRSALQSVIYRHLWDITRKYSRGSSANNHLVGEATGVFIASSYFPELPGAPRWRDESQGILTAEIMAQTYEDGGSREQALGYHISVLQFFLLAGIVGRTTGRLFPPAYWKRLERMLDFLAALCEGGPPPMFGDCDDGYVLDLGSGEDYISALLATSSVLFRRLDFRDLAGDYAEPTRWLLGRASRTAFTELVAPSSPALLRSRAFPRAGYYLLQYGKLGEREAVSVVFDCGELGLGALAAHGHADALSFTVRALGQEIFVDPGTYDYYCLPAWRAYYRSTRAHNTVVVDGCDQSVPLGPFLWGARAQARCTAWLPQPDGGRVAGEHDGFRRLRDPVLHRRTLSLHSQGRVLTIQDDLIGRSRHEAAIYFHLAEDCEVTPAGVNRFHIAVNEGYAIFEIDRKLSVEQWKGSDDPIAGWVSHGYHDKIPTLTLRASIQFHATASLTHRVEIEPAR